MTRFLISLLIVVLCISCSRASFPEDIRILDEEISRRELYDQAFREKAQALRMSLNWTFESAQKYKFNKILADEYSHHCFDSSQSFYLQNLSLAKQLGDKRKIAETQISLTQNFVYGGYFNEAVESIKAVDTLSLDKSLKQEYIYSWVILSRNLRTHGPNSESFDFYQKQLEKYLSELKDVVDSSSFRYAYVEWEESRNVRNLEVGPELAEKMIAAARPGTCDYSEACLYASFSYKDLGNRERMLHYLCLSAANDIRMSKKDDNRSIADICDILLGNWEGAAKAFSYIIEMAYPNSLEFKGTRDLDYLAKVMTKVESEYRTYSERTHKHLLISLIAVCILACGLVCVLKYIQSNNKKLRKTKDKLSEANRVKEEYITSFISQIAESETGRRKYFNHVIQMIRKGRSEDLIKEMEAVPDEETEIRNFNMMFDSTFLGIYPDFIDRFNSLLKEGEEIRPKEEGSLCPELRIYALCKLGIKDLKKIASLLKYSQTTIYNYRAKVKSKSRYPDTDFDSLISKL